MRRTAVWAGVLAVASIGVLVTCVNGTDREVQLTNQDEITIQVGPTKYSYVDIEGNKIWVPEFPDPIDGELRDDFLVTVDWDEETIKTKFEEWGIEAEEDKKLTLTLSGFELVSRNPTWESGEGQVWEQDERYELYVTEMTSEGEERKLGPEASLVFEYDLKAASDRTSKTVKIERIKKVGKGEDEERSQLVFFKLTLSRGNNKVLFEVDPPWVPKPPTG